MAIDYTLATKVIGNAINYAMNGLDYLVGKNYKPAFAIASTGSNIAPDPKLYRKETVLPTLDAHVRAYYSTPEVQTSHLPSAKEILYRLLNF